MSPVLNESVRRQEILRELALTALRGAPFGTLLEDTARLAALGLGAEFAQVLESLPSEKRLVVRAGTGWAPGVVGTAKVDGGTGSPAGFALSEGKAVISGDLATEKRFGIPDLLHRHGIRRVIDVIVAGDGGPFGVLEAGASVDGRFGEEDLAFLQGAADILGLAIGRERRDRDLEAAAERERVLRGEMNHRINNMLMIVSSMLQLQARDVEDAAVTVPLQDAAHRVAAVAHSHDQLFKAADTGGLDLGKYIEAVCRELYAGAARCTVRVDADAGIELPTDHAITVALIASELVSMLVRHAPPGSSKRTIGIALRAPTGGELTVSVRDEADGMPAGFDLANPTDLGMHLITSFAQQLGGTLDMQSRAPGTDFVLTIPRKT